MDLISRDDAIKALRKAILNLMDGLPTTNIDGEEYCADNRLHNAYLEANKAVSNALREIPSWHTDDPEESGEYLVTYEFTHNGKVYRKITIAEWASHLTNCDGDIVEYGEWYIDYVGDVVAWMPLPDKYEGDMRELDTICDNCILRGQDESGNKCVGCRKVKR